MPDSNTFRETRATGKGGKVHRQIVSFTLLPSQIAKLKIISKHKVFADNNSRALGWLLDSLPHKTIDAMLRDVKTGE